MVTEFIKSNEHRTLVLPDRLMINQCFYHFKTLYKTLEKKQGGGALMLQKENQQNGNADAVSEKVVTKTDPVQEQEI